LTLAGAVDANDLAQAALRHYGELDTQPSNLETELYQSAIITPAKSSPMPRCQAML